MKVLSLFDGISCARVALDRAGIKVDDYFASEIDKYAISVSNDNYPDIIRLGDVKGVHGIHHMQGLSYGLWNLEQIDLLIGGSPCQDLSIAKKNRKGLDGDRSGLFWEYVRILREVKPKYFILENVASMPKEAKEIISMELGVEPIMIDASLVSAQSRKRLFWTNIPNVTLPEDKGIFLKDILENGDVDRLKSYCIDANYYKGASWDQYKRRGARQLVRMGNIGSNAQAHRVYSPEGKSVALSALGGGQGAKTGLYIQPVALRNRGEGKKPEYNKTGKANAMTTVQTDSMVQVNEMIRKLTPIECERLQGLPDGYTGCGISDTQRYKCLGNAFNVDVICHILKFMPKQ